MSLFRGFDISDSGRSTLLDEIRAEGDGSPLPSGIWSYSQTSCINNHELHCGSPVANRQQDGIRSGVVITHAGNGVGKIGSSCCGENNTRDIGASNTSSSSHIGRSNNRRRQHNSSSENTYKSFAYGEDSDLFEALAGGTGDGGCGGGSHLGNIKSPAQGDEENDKAFDVHTDESSASASVSFYPHRTFKVILAGDAAVGKSTFIERICHGHFTPNLSSTIGKYYVFFYPNNP